METPKADRSIEKFLKDLDNDLVCYASFFRVPGFTSSRTIKFLKEKDFISLGVEVPTGNNWTQKTYSECCREASDSGNEVNAQS